MSNSPQRHGLSFNKGSKTNIAASINVVNQARQHPEPNERAYVSLQTTNV
jgi:hypothetical protein